MNMRSLADQGGRSRLPEPAPDHPSRGGAN